MGISRNVRAAPRTQNLNHRPMLHTVPTVSLSLKYGLGIYIFIAVICIILWINIISYFNSLAHQMVTMDHLIWGQIWGKEVLVIY